MTVIQLPSDPPFSDAAIEAAIMELRNNSKIKIFTLELTVSIFDVDHAVRIMIDKRYFDVVRYIHITPEYCESEYSLADRISDTIVTNRRL